VPLHPVATRYRPLAWVLAIFLAASTLTRLVLLVAAGSGVPARPGYWLDVFGIGFAYDLLAFVYFAWPLVLLLWLLRSRAQSRVYLAGPKGQFSTQRTIPFGPPNVTIRMAEAADLDGDGMLDLVTIDERHGTAIYFGRTDATFSHAGSRSRSSVGSPS